MIPDQTMYGYDRLAMPVSGYQDMSMGPFNQVSLEINGIMLNALQRDLQFRKKSCQHLSEFNNL
jgi:hypothetical protein